jgi:hypothetical protein
MDIEKLKRNLAVMHEIDTLYEATELELMLVMLLVDFMAIMNWPKIVCIRIMKICLAIMEMVESE